MLFNFLFICSLLFFLSSNKSLAITIDEAIEEAKNNNKTIKMEDYKLQSAESLKREALGEFLPSVKASAQYGSRRTNFSATKNGHYETKELEVEQPLFSGFQSVAKYREADYKVKSKTSENKNKKHEIILSAITSYCNLFRYQELIKLQEENKKLANSLFSLIKRRGELKINDKSEVIKFRYELANIESSYFEISNKLAKAEYEYQNVIGELHKNITKPTIAQEDIMQEATIQNAIENNQNLKSYHFNYLASKAAYNAELASLSPTVSLVGSISNQQNAFYYSGQDYNNKSIYFNISVPIFQKGIEYSNIIKASHDKSAAKEEFEVIKDNLIKELRQTIEEYNFYRQFNFHNKQLVVLAKDRADIFKKRFDAGIEDPIETIRAKIEFNQRKAELINSEMDLVIAYHKIKFYLGEI